DAVGGGEDKAVISVHTLTQAAADIFSGFFVGAGLEQAAVDVADGADLVAVLFPDFCQIHAALRVNGVEGVGTAGNDLVQNGVDVAVGVFDGVVAQAAIGVNALLQMGGHQLLEHIGREE